MERRWWCTLYILTLYLIFFTSRAGVKIFRLVSKTCLFWCENHEFCVFLVSKSLELVCFWCQLKMVLVSTKWQISRMPDPGIIRSQDNLSLRAIWQRPFFIWILSSSMIIILFIVLLPPPTWQRRESVSLRSKRWAAWRCLEHTGRSPSRAPGWQSHTQLV